MNPSRNYKRIFLTVISLLFIFSACNPSQQEITVREIITIENQSKQTVNAIEETIMSGENFSIQANTQLTFKDLRIGAGNFWEEEYTNFNNETITGLTAGLWIYVKDQPQENKTIRVFPGMKIAVSGYEIFVKSVLQQNGTEFVELIIKK